MPHLSAMDWDFAEKLCHITRGTTEAYYSYDGNGIRTRKVVEKNGIVETRLYLGGFEIWRKTVNGVLDTERETLHVMDDQRRIALVETLTVENGNRVAGPAPVQRYQLDNHLGSASLRTSSATRNTTPTATPATARAAPPARSAGNATATPARRRTRNPRSITANSATTPRIFRGGSLPTPHGLRTASTSTPTYTGIP